MMTLADFLTVLVRTRPMIAVFEVVDVGRANVVRWCWSFFDLGIIFGDGGLGSLLV